MQLAHRIFVQPGDLRGRPVRLRLQRVEQQHRPPQELRLVHRVPGGAGGTDQQRDRECPVAPAFRSLDTSLEQAGMVRRQAERGVDQLLGLVRPAEIPQEHRLRAQGLRPLAVVVQQRLFAVMQRERLVPLTGGGEQASGGFEVGPVARIQEERILVADGRALRVAELLEEDPPHRVVHRRRGRNVAQGGRLAFEVCQRVLRRLDLIVAGMTLRGRDRGLLGDDRVHGEGERTRASRVQSASERRARGAGGRGPHCLWGDV